MIYRALFLSLLMPLNAFASEVITTFLLPRPNSFGKHLSVTYLQPFLKCLRYGATIGTLTEDAFTSNIAPYGELNVGVEVASTLGLYARVLTGASFFKPNDHLMLNAKWFEISTSVSAGIKEGPYMVGAQFKHFSNGTDSSTNTGMEYLGIEVGREF